jgi:hypothetical protein
MAPPASSPQRSSDRPLRARLAALGEAFATREAEHRASLEEAWREAERLHALAADALDGLHAALDAHGSTHFRVVLGPVRLDDKHVRAVQFELLRGRTVALVTVKSRGDVTFVGPFRSGKTEGPCESVPWDRPSAVDTALGEFLERFLEQAATP